MESVGLLVKSHAADLGYATRLMSSLDRYNTEALPTWVVVPDEDVPAFARFAGRERQVLPESEFAQHLVEEPIGGLRVGYANQEIVKLAFWELGLVDNYFTIDSDAVIVREFGRSDLMFDENTPYTVLVEDNDLKMDPTYYRENWQGRESALRKIQAEVGLLDPRMLTCHGHQIMSARGLRSLKEEFLEPRGWTYRDMIDCAPYEYSWYNFWLQASAVIPIRQREPIIKVLHSAQQHLEFALAGIGPDDVARGYVGIVVNSNFARSWGADIRHDEPQAATLARYLSWRTLLTALRTKTVAAIKGRLGG